MDQIDAVADYTLFLVKINIKLTNFKSRSKEYSGE